MANRIALQSGTGVIDLQSGTGDILLQSDVAAYILTAAAGSYSISGQAATLLKSKLLVAETGSYAIAGQPASLVYVPASGAFTLTAEAGSYAIAGQAADLVYTPTGAFTFTAESGSYTIAGQAATLTYEPIIVEPPVSQEGSFGGGSNIWTQQRHDVPRRVAEQRLSRIMKALDRLRKRKRPPTPSELADIALGLEAAVEPAMPHSGDLLGLAMDVRLVAELPPIQRAGALAIQVKRAKRIADDIEDEEVIMALLLAG